MNLIELLEYLNGNGLVIEDEEAILIALRKAWLSPEAPMPIWNASIEDWEV